MDFLATLLQTIAFVPALVNGIEGLFSHRTGPEKRDAALSFLEAALSMSSASPSSDCRSRKIQARPRACDRRHGRVPKCFRLGKGDDRLTHNCRS